MEIILLERVAKLGSLGQVVKVKDGFARNFLLRRGKALRSPALRADGTEFLAELALSAVGSGADFTVLVAIRNVDDKVAAQAELIEPTTGWESELTDPWDQAVLGTLVASRADHLVTGDKRLLSLAGKYPVIDPASFVLRCF